MNTFSNPIDIIQNLSIARDAHIADFGSGSGTYTFLLADGFPERKIFSVDIQKDMIDKIQLEAERKGLHNIHAIWGDIDEKEGSLLRDDSIDLVFITNTLFQVENPKLALEEAKRILKIGGRLIVIDWSDSFNGMGPHQNHVIGKNKMKEMLEDVGFLIEKELDFVGDHHYGFLAKKF